ncbi:MAG TPA: phosphoglucosamine mutase [Chroococcidiopsis sp.]
MTISLRSPFNIPLLPAIAAYTQHALMRQPSDWLPKSIFGTDGIRGRVGDFLNAPLAHQIGYWTGCVWQAHGAQGSPVILGHDSRNSSGMLAEAFSRGLTAAGLDVWYLGLCSTPAVAYLTQAVGATGGIMITASHNPPEDNGIKFFSTDGCKLAPALQREIEQGLRGELNLGYYTVAPDFGKRYFRPSLLKQYTDSLQQSLPAEVDLSGLRIVVDVAWGAAVYLAQTAFQNLGAEVIYLHDQPDGDRINVNCGATHLTPLKEAVQGYQADLGFAFDGDADRIMAVDGLGRALDGDYILYLLGKQLLESGQLPNHTIVSTVMANIGFERAWNQLGGTLLRTPVGDQHVYAAMMEHQAVLGGEPSGHILCRHYGVEGDGLLTALHLAAFVKQSGRSLAELRDHSFYPYPQCLKNVRITNQRVAASWQTCDPLQKLIVDAEANLGSHGRVLIRESGTEPLLRIMVETAQADLAHYWGEQLAQVAETYLSAK